MTRKYLKILPVSAVVLTVKWYYDPIKEKNAPA